MSDSDCESVETMPFDENETALVLNHRRFLHEGGACIRNGDYLKAIFHFNNSHRARAINLRLLPGRMFLGVRFQRSLEELRSIANIIAMNSSYSYGKGELVLAGIFLERADRQPDIPQQLLHDIALIGFEEYGHALQDRIGPLAGEEDFEIDIARYLAQQGIPMTDTFLQRYGRREVIQGENSYDDSLTKRPSMRKGVFVRVRRSDGSQEDDWQIAGFDPRTGDARVIKIRTGEYKWYPQRALAELNEEGVFPFRNCKTALELFWRLDSLGGVYGLSGLVKSTELKRRIEGVRKGKLALEYIPRSGGLRQQVARIMIQDADSWGELLKVINLIGEIHGTRNRFPREVLSSLIKGVRSGQRFVTELPREAGIRDKVIDLIKRK